LLFFARKPFVEVGRLSLWQFTFYLICWPVTLFHSGNQFRSIGDVFTEENTFVTIVTILLQPRVLEMMMFREHLSGHRPSQSGQGMLEYALIVFLIAVVAILGVVFLVPVIIQGITGVLPAL
jgi:hypothetical protein